jgi:hypothetical protein
VEAAVLEELFVVGETDEGVLRAPEAGVGEGQAQAVQQRVEAERDEEEKAGEEKQIGSQRASSYYAAFRLDPLTISALASPLETSDSARTAALSPATGERE